MTNIDQRIALLIDADNTQVSKIESAILEISKYGKILVKRAYGNWSKETLKNWEEPFRKLAIKPMQQIDYNSEYDGFAIVSSDSDFTPLTIKLRESGKTVIGIGNKKTSEAFVASCDDFIYLEDLSEQKNEETEKTPDKKQEDKFDELNRLIKIAYDTYQNDSDFVNISIAGSYIKRVKPEFNIKSYKVKKLVDYFKKYPKLYEIKEHKSGRKMIFEYRIKD